MDIIGYSCGYNCGSNANILVCSYVTTKLLSVTANLVSITVPLIWWIQIPFI